MAQHGTFYWNELRTTDPAGAAAFYAGLTGATVTEMAMPDGPYRVLMQGEKPMGGVMAMPPGLPPHWFGYLAVDDVDASCARVRELGGQIVMEPFEVEGVGRIAILLDVAGAAIGLITPVAGR